MKNKILISAVLLIASSFAAAAESTSPSFDCTKASSHAEIMICSDPDLANLDAQLSAAYKSAQSKTIDYVSFKRDQIEWLKKVRNVCDDVACLKAAYQRRLSVLGSFTGNGQQDLSEGARQAVTSVEPPAEPTERPSGADSQSSTKVAETKLVATSPAQATNSIPNPVQSNTSDKASLGEKPNAGFVSSIASFFHGIIVLVFMIGLINPRLILRTSPNPTRKKLFLYMLMIGLPIGGVAEYFKSNAAKAYEAKEVAIKKSEKDAQFAQQQENYRRMDAKKAGKHLYDLYKRWPGNENKPGIDENEFIDGEVLNTCAVGGKYKGYYGWIKIRNTFIDGLHIKDQDGFVLYVFLADYGQNLSGLWRGSQYQQAVVNAMQETCS